MKKYLSLFISAISGLLFVILIFLVRCVDYSYVGPQNSRIGLSTINLRIFEKIGVNYFWYNLTDYLGFLAVLTVCVYAIIGLIQLIKRKSLLKVDNCILLLGVLYIISLILYFLFEKIVVNYRPIILKDSTKLEASFPSSHTMMIIVVLGSSFLTIKRYHKINILRIVIQLINVLTIIVTIIGRLLSGAHWFTDILGGILLGTFLITFYNFILNRIELNYLS